MDQSEQKLREDFNQFTKDEAKLTKDWYARMSGIIPWKPGERESYLGIFGRIENQIRGSSGNAEWFAELPDE